MHGIASARDGAEGGNRVDLRLQTAQRGQITWADVACPGEDSRRRWRGGEEGRYIDVVSERVRGRRATASALRLGYHLPGYDIMI